MTQAPFTIQIEATITPPPGLTIEDMERLAREADEARRAAANPQEN